MVHCRHTGRGPQPHTGGVWRPVQRAAPGVSPLSAPGRRMFRRSTLEVRLGRQAGLGQDAAQAAEAPVASLDMSETGRGVGQDSAGSGQARPGPDRHGAARDPAGLGLGQDTEQARRRAVMGRDRRDVSTHTAGTQRARSHGPCVVSPPRPSHTHRLRCAVSGANRRPGPAGLA